MKAQIKSNFLLHVQKQANLLPIPTSQGGPTCAQTPDGKHNDHVTCSGNGIKPNKPEEACCCSLENPIKTKWCKPSRTWRAQAMMREGMRKNMGEVSSSTPTGLLPSHHKYWPLGPRHSDPSAQVSLVPTLFSAPYHLTCITVDKGTLLT